MRNDIKALPANKNGAINKPRYIFTTNAIIIKIYIWIPFVSALFLKSINLPISNLSILM